MSLEIRNLKQSYGRQPVFQGVSFVLNPGDLVALIGRNGSGKTTLFRSMVGILQPKEGEILLDGTALKQDVSLMNDLFYVPDRYDYFNQETLHTVLKYYQTVYNRFDPEFFRRGLEQLQIHPYPKAVMGQFSKGEKMILATLIGLATGCHYLLLDEPYDGIDVINTGKLNQIIIEAAERQVGIMISSHRLHELAKITDRTLYLEPGRGVTAVTDTSAPAWEKYQIVFTATPTAPIPESPEILILNQMGRVCHLMTTLPRKDIEAWFSRIGVVQYDVIPVMMEDIFRWEDRKGGLPDVQKIR